MNFFAIFFTTLFSLLLTTNITYALSLHSTAFAAGSMLPTQYTCDGNNHSPQLSWDAIPTKTLSLTLIMSDPDATSGIFYHWVLINLPTNIFQLKAALSSLPKGALTLENSWQQNNYNGPCPPKGKLHHYHFTLYALDQLLILPTTATATDVLQSMQHHILAKTELVATYEK